MAVFRRGNAIGLGWRTWIVLVVCWICVYRMLASSCWDTLSVVRSLDMICALRDVRYLFKIISCIESRN